VPISGDRPETGVRILVERDKSRSDPPWTYVGAAHLPDADVAIHVVVDAGGDVIVTLSATRPELEERVRLIMRTAYRLSKADGEPPPWRILRWRGVSA
jgi:hypothetical protein